MTPWANWEFWDPNKQPLPKEIDFYRKISICTTCMNRAEDLKKTLFQNMKDNSDYPNVEYVILDYNSREDLTYIVREAKTWAIRNLDRDCVTYGRTTEPQYFSMAHSRNLAFKLASGMIVNNVDADNFTGKGFATCLNKLAMLQSEKAVFSKGKRMLHGRIGFYKKEFMELGGYDEDLQGYGADDSNLLYRAMASGYKLMWWGPLGDFSNRIKTSKKNKAANMENPMLKQTENRNKAITEEKLKKKQYVANIDRLWGHAWILKNWNEEITL